MCSLWLCRNILRIHPAVKRGCAAGTLEQQKPTIERVSSQIGLLARLVEENEDKGRVAQVLSTAE